MIIEKIIEKMEEVKVELIKEMDNIPPTKKEDELFNELQNLRKQLKEAKNNDNSN